MIRQNLLLFYRNVRRYKTTFFINVVGLSVGIACVLVMYLWVKDEWSIDRYHETDARLFQVMEHSEMDKGIITHGHTQDFLAGVLAAEMPEVEHAVTVTPPFFFPAFTLTADDRHVNGVGKYVSEDFFKTFTYDLLEGKEDRVLADRNSIVLSERMARRLFPGVKAITGKTLEYDLQTLKRQVTITGIFKDVPRNSSEQFDFALSFDAFREIMGFTHKTLEWDAIAPFFTYVTLKEGTNVHDVNQKLAGYIKTKSANAGQRTLFLKRFSDNYLYGKYENGVVTGGRIEYVKLFSVVSVFILLIACVNFMNLATARASRRLKEIGIKKVVGASRKTLVTQYISESLLMSGLALLLALLFVDIFLPHFNVLTAKKLQIAFEVELVLAAVIVTVIAGLLAGSYPAFYLSGFNTARVLRGRIIGWRAELLARKGLVIFQFSLSIIFIVAVLVVFRQMQFVLSKDLGYDRENVLYFETSGKVAAQPEAMLAAIKAMPGVVNASSMLGNMIGGSGTTLGGGTQGTHFWQGKAVAMNVSQVNYDLIETLGIEILDGRSFSREFSADTLQYIYNETAIEALGIEDPVGRILPGGIVIVGVAKDFHYNSLHLPVQPHCFLLEPDYAMNIFVKLRAGMEKETIEEIAHFYKTFNPGYAFDYSFMDGAYAAQYAAEQQVATLSRYCAFLAILISCLGLFGLAAFTAEKRTKEIGIRKVLGSGVGGIVFLLTKEFSKIVLVAILISLPVSYIIVSSWLERFAFKVSLEWWYFPCAGILALTIAFLTVGTHAIKAAFINPAKCLRDE